DGMYLVTVLIVRAMQMKQQGKTLGAMIADLKEPLESSEIRLNILEKDFRKKGQEVIDRVLECAEKDTAWHIAPDNREGIRVSFNIDGEKDSGWFLLRMSVHDPVLPGNCESDVNGGVKKILKNLFDIIQDIEGIDISSLERAI
ncbi:MAG: phosphomannomutase/phosphoglucomutase, partial [Clostridia bacterium]|nr:phosphomannomutase/phosphoglucomutase [Clostridia bacterium]